MSSLLDFGCGEGSLLSYLRSEPRIRRMAGIDVDEAALQQAAERTEPSLYERVVKRPHPLTISLHRGSICSPALTRQLLRAAHGAAQEVSGGSSSSEAEGERAVDEDWDAITLVEVIEHLEPHDLPAMEASVFGRCRPRYVVVTTPNYEFNVVFNDPLGAHVTSSGKRVRPDTDTTSSSASLSTTTTTTTTATSSLPFRHYDHKFEWTRAQFAEWYGYRYTLSGVGTRQGWTNGTDHAVEGGGGEEEEEEEEEGKETALARPAASSKRKCPTSPGVEDHKEPDDGEEDDVGFCTQIAYFTRLEDDYRTTPNKSTATATEEPLQLYAVHAFPVDTRSDTEKLAAVVAYAYGHVVVGSEGELEYGDWVSVADRLLPLPPVRESCSGTSPDRLRAELRAIAAEPSRYFGLEYDESMDSVRIAAYADSDEDEEEPPADDGDGALFLENESEGDSRRSNQAAAERPSPVWAACEEDGAWGQSWGDNWDHE